MSTRPKYQTKIVGPQSRFFLPASHRRNHAFIAADAVYGAEGLFQQLPDTTRHSIERVLWQR